MSNKPYYCWDCSHIVDVVDEKCEVCGGNHWGVFWPSSKIKSAYRPTYGRTFSEEPDVYRQINYGVTFRLAMGYRLLKEGGDR